MVEESPVTRSSLRRLSPTSAPVAMAELPSRVWSDGEWERITLGHKARSMDEKWHVLVEDRVAYLHRSWTGNGIYAATFAPAGDGWLISAATVESDPARHRRVSDRYDRVMLELVLSSIVLGEPAAELLAELGTLTARTTGRTDLPAGVIEHSALGQRTSR